MGISNYNVLQYFCGPAVPGFSSEAKLITPQEVISRLMAYSKNVDAELIEKAFIFAIDRHGTQLRESGDPFFSHPIEVAEILVSLKTDQETVIAGLLHDTVEDTDTSIAEIEENFGSGIARIVDGVTKLSQFESGPLAVKQTENFKKLLISAASDIRVLIIKLADRLHNMRTLQYKKREDKRKLIAKETLEVYAPLAERVGITSIKEELQDTAFLELYPEIYNSIKSRLKNLYDSSEEIINTITSRLYELAKSVDIDCSITGRLKSPYSIWSKMNVRSISFEQLSDIMAFRIIVGSVQQCYQTLGCIHRNYLVIPGRFRDYISTPKNNSYQSLHTCIIGPINKRIEIQIRTKEMHDVAEYGIAAHWDYKERGTKSQRSEEQKWLKSLVQILENASGMDEFLENSRTEILADHIFCITPKGTIISLPIGSSALDFAYAIHSDIGNHAVSAKVNGQTVHVKTILSNGDQIDIVTDPNHVPKPHWEEYVISMKAKVNLRKAIHGIEKEKTEMIGKSVFDDFFKKISRTVSEDDINRMVTHLKFDNKIAMFQAIGSGSIHIKEILACYNAVCHGDGIELLQYAESSNGTEQFPIAGIRKENVLQVACCSPVPGDKIVGVILENQKIEIHIDECNILPERTALSNTRIVELSWEKSAFEESRKYPTKISLVTVHEPGNLSKIAGIIEDRGATILNLKIGEKMDGLVKLHLEIEVHDITQLTIIMANLKRTNFAHGVTRFW
ncbi:MAG: RelA/SpoT family protein [Holosporales bacterium]|jgi:GTP pyrophosphokinase|nr:RelA/SpoT family protein [Holosporales bacterium]